MPIKTKYEIYDTRHTAPVNETYDYTAARVEFNELMRKASQFYRMVCTPMADGALTKPEEYLLLVYRVRKLWKQYFNQGRDHAVMLKSLEEDKKLDDWNARTRTFLNSHLSVMDGQTSERFGFFTIVEEWRKTWKERKRYAKLKDHDPAVLNEMGKKCRDLGYQIDNYVHDKLRLI